MNKCHNGIIIYQIIHMQMEIIDTAGSRTRYHHIDVGSLNLRSMVPCPI